MVFFFYCVTQLMLNFVILIHLVVQNRENIEA